MTQDRPILADARHVVLFAMISPVRTGHGGPLQREAPPPHHPAASGRGLAVVGPDRFAARP